MAIRKVKKGQIAIWVILAIILVGSIILFFTLRNRIDVGQTPVGSGSDPEEPASFLQICVERSVKESLEVMIPQGGFLEPRNYRQYNGTRITYLCENVGNYDPCINQHPLLIEEIERQLESELLRDFSVCLDDLRDEVERNAGTFEYDGRLELEDIEVELAQDRVFVNIETPIRITKRDVPESFEEIDVAVVSPAYNLARIASEIVNQEAVYCYFEYVGYNLFYPRYRVTRTTLSEPTKIYTILDRDTDITMQIAIRSCAYPPGI